MTDTHAPAEAPAAAGPPAPSPAAPTSWSPPRKSPGARLGIALLALAAIIAIFYAWELPPFSGWSQETDDAYVRGKVTVIGPQVSGYIVSLPVQDFAEVKAGQVLARIDDRIYSARVAQAHANLSAQLANLANSQQAERAREAQLVGQQAGITNAQAQLVRANADMRRAQALVADGSISTRERDQTLAAQLQAQAALRQAHAAHDVGREDVQSVRVGRAGLAANVEAARAQLRLAQVDLDNTIIRAPADGQLSELGVRLGAFASAGTQLMYLVPHAKWIVANFRETQTHRMAVGQLATFTVDALGNARLKGHIESLAPAAATEFSVLKPDNATGNFVKVAQRIAVRISIDPGQPLAARLRPGMSVVVDVQTRARR